MALDDRFPQILEAARAGGEWAWTLIYRDLAPVILGYLRTQGAREPEDLLGEVFLQVVRGLPAFEGDEAGFRSWVFIAAHHRVIDERRFRGRHPEDPVPHDALERPSEQDVAADVLESVATERIRRILDRLSLDQRAVLLLRLVGGLTIEEVAQAVDKRVGAVKALQRRGLAAVKRDLEREGVPL